MTNYKYSHLLVFIFSISAFLVSCEKNTHVYVNGMVKWTVNGQAFQGTSSALAARIPPGSNSIIVSGFTSGDNSFQFVLDSITSRGTFKIGTPGYNFNTIRITFNGKEYEAHNAARNGVFIVTVDQFTSDRIAGTLNGAFNISGELTTVTASFDVKIL